MTPIARSPEQIIPHTQLIKSAKMIGEAGAPPRPNNDNTRSVSLLERRRKRSLRRTAH